MTERKNDITISALFRNYSIVIVPSYLSFLIGQIVFYGYFLANMNCENECVWLIWFRIIFANITLMVYASIIFIAVIHYGILDNMNAKNNNDNNGATIEMTSNINQSKLSNRKASSDKHTANNHQNDIESYGSDKEEEKGDIRLDHSHRNTNKSNESEQVQIKSQRQKPDIQNFQVEVKITNVEEEKEEELHSQVPQFEGEDVGSAEYTPI